MFGFRVLLDTLIVAIGERPHSDFLATMGIEIDKNGRVHIDFQTLQTIRDGVFAGGDLITGSNTVVDAIASGKKAANIIDRYLQGKDLVVPPKIKLPQVFIEAAIVSDEEPGKAMRVNPPTLPVKKRYKNFKEVVKTLSVEAARSEAHRCLRCDLGFTQHKNKNIKKRRKKGEKG